MVLCLLLVINIIIKIIFFKHFVNFFYCFVVCCKGAGDACVCVWICVWVFCVHVGLLFDFWGVCVCLCLDILVVVCNMTVDKNVLSASLNKTFAYFLLQLLQLLNVLPVPLAIAAPINHVPRELNIGHVCSPRHTIM